MDSRLIQWFIPFNFPLISIGRERFKVLSDIYFAVLTPFTIIYGRSKQMAKVLFTYISNVAPKLLLIIIYISLRYTYQVFFCSIIYRINQRAGWDVFCGEIPRTPEL
ncbi:MAG: hypothetical protein RL621_18 [Bacteroidota bacterium]